MNISQQFLPSRPAHPSGAYGGLAETTMTDAQYARRRAQPMNPSTDMMYTHSRTRTTSSNVFPVTSQQQYQQPQQQHQQYQQPPQQYQQQQQQQQYLNQYSNGPQNGGHGYPQHMQVQMHLHQPQQQNNNHQRRSPSVGTFSTVSSGGGGTMGMAPPPAAYRTSPVLDIRRSTSSRSGTGSVTGSPHASGYVALLRKQKATVWCDRAQYEDPRLLAQQRAAKMRANLEVVGSNNGGSGGGGGASGGGNGGLGPSAGRTSTGLSSAGGKVAAKIRHHGKPAVVGYSPDSNYVGVGGVPPRLSATEVEGEDSDENNNNNGGSDDITASQRLQHRRTGSSSRSSTASGRRVLAAGGAYRTSGGGGSGSLGPSNSQGRRRSPGDTPERSGSLSLVDLKEGELIDDGGSGTGSVKARSFGSGSSGERLDAVPDMGTNAARLASKSAALNREKSVRNPEDLRRRGSVDERTMTLTSGRLFIANPD